MVAYTEIMLLIDIVAGVFGSSFDVLDAVMLVTSGVPTLGSISVLDGFLIGGFIFDLFWEYIDRMRGVD